MPRYFIQLSGVPGSGKSSVAQALAPCVPAVVLDHDVTKTALLGSGVDATRAGAASYGVIKALSVALLRGAIEVPAAALTGVAWLEQGGSSRA